MISAVRLAQEVYQPREDCPTRNPGGRDLSVSDKQLEANRQRALQSTGPETAKGFEAVKKNATRDRRRSVQTMVPGRAPQSQSLGPPA